MEVILEELKLGHNISICCKVNIAKTYWVYPNWWIEDFSVALDT